MQSLVSNFHTRTGRWLVLLLVLLGVYVYIELAPRSQKTVPYDTKDIQELEELLKKTFVPRIDRIGPQDKVEVKVHPNTDSALQNTNKPTTSSNSASQLTTGRYMTNKMTTTRPAPRFFGQTLKTTFKPAILHPSGYFKSTADENAKIKEVSSSGLTISEIPNVQVKEVNCARVIEGDPVETYKAEEYQNLHPKVPIPERMYLNMARDCPKFKKERQYLSKPASAEEVGFPIAYSIMMFKDVEQTERLLRAIYRPQNYYCIHVDKKSSLDIHRTMEAIAGCFDNVFIAPKAIDVQWGWFSVVEPDILCMEELFKRYKKWRYFINLTGQEFPLKTNLDLVRILRTFNGSNNMEGTEQRRNTERTEYIHNGFWPTDSKKGPPPAGITLTKGSVHITASRAFVDFILHNKIAKQFKQWVKDTGVPDETFFSSLNHSPQLGVPGAYKGQPETSPVLYPFITRFKNWGTWPFDYPCSGQRIRMVCVFGVGDLHILSQRPEFFANKFYLDYHPLALDCMEELHYNRTRQELEGTLSFDTRYYKTLGFVKNHV